MPQWDFLDFLSDHAKTHPTFKLIMQAEVTELLRDHGQIVGLRATTPEGLLEVRADLVVGADGRHSVVRDKARLPIMNLGAPIDALWMRVSRDPGDPDMTFGRFDRGRIMAMLNRGTYWQCAYVIPKGEIEQIKARGLDAFRASIGEVLPFLRDRLGELRSWDDIKLLTVRVDRLKEWCCQGLLCIGDAAHAMSPVGGVGINLAIQDAVAAANSLAGPLKRGLPGLSVLQQVQARREWPTVVTQWMQVFVQNTIFRSALSGRGWEGLPLPLRILQRYPDLARFPGRMIGWGVRPEHVNTPEASRP